MSLKAKIKAGAESLGFVAVGFTNIDPVPGLNRYKNWVETGQHAGMHYLADERALAARADPRRLLPSCKTVISLLWLATRKVNCGPSNENGNRHKKGEFCGLIRA